MPFNKTRVCFPRFYIYLLKNQREVRIYSGKAIGFSPRGSKYEMNSQRSAIQCLLYNVIITLFIQCNFPRRRFK